MQSNKVMSNYLTLHHACTCVHVPRLLLNLSFKILSKCHQNTCSSICTSLINFFLREGEHTLPNPPPARHFVPRSALSCLKVVPPLSSITVHACCDDNCKNDNCKNDNCKKIIIILTTTVKKSTTTVNK